MTRKRGVRRTPLEVVEGLVTERYGVGSAISVDRAGSYYVVTAWSPDGEPREVSIVGNERGGGRRPAT